LDRDDLDNENEEFDVLVLVDDEGIEHSFELIAELEIDDSFYVVVAPIDDEDADTDADATTEEDSDEETEVLLFKATYDDEGNMFLADIEDDEEWEKVANAWQELVDSEEIQ
jgi:uncharacterized protein YrzB (UPF0473 family)